MTLPANTTNQSNAVMLQQSTYSTLPQEFVLYNALSGDNTSAYAHYERTTMGWSTLSALSAFAITTQAIGNGVPRDIYIQTPSTNKIVLSAGLVVVPGSIVSGAYLNIQSGTTYTFQLSDNGAMIGTTSSNSVIATPSSSIPYPTGFQVGVIQLGTGRIALSAAGTPNINQANGYYKTTKLYSAATLIYTGGSTGWVTFGDLAV
jgi:hypothetical protein